MSAAELAALLVVAAVCGCAAVAVRRRRQRRDERPQRVRVHLGWHRRRGRRGGAR